ncbi:MAG: histidinol-phosphate transaminase [Actinomycetes bacterium]
MVKQSARDLKTMPADNELWPAWLPIRSELRELKPYGAPQIANVIHLNTNENPFELPKAVAEALRARIEVIASSLNRYPDRDAVELRTDLASYINLAAGTDFDLNNVWAANGSNEILQTLLLACGGVDSLVLGFTPSYSVHPLIAKITGTPWKSGSRNADFTLDAPAAVLEISAIAPALVFITTPNNPTGNALAINEIRELAIAALNVGALLVVDEAYQEFSNELSAVTLISEFPNIVVTRTMSKAFAFAGARVGYLIARPEVIDGMLIARLPYHLSSLTQAAAQVALKHQSELQAEVQILIAERNRIAAAIIALGLSVIPSSANFLLFTGFRKSAELLWQEFLDGGVLIRDVGLPGYLRVTVGTAAENDHFLALLQRLAP